MNHTRILSTAAALLLVAQVSHAQGRGHDDRDQHGRSDDQGRGQQISQQEQQRRIQEDQKRSADYQQKLNAQVQQAQARAAELQNQKRSAQYAAHQQYLQNLQQQQQRLQAQRDYSRDPYYSTPANYRYRLNGAYHQTNQYGVDVLKQAVNYGYQQGYQSGQADRADRVRSNYRNSYAYQDANYGYNGNYVAQTDYNYYFRQGFQRGYDDGYNSRNQYGSFSNGSGSILGNILTSILGLQPLR